MAEAAKATKGKKSRGRKAAPKNGEHKNGEQSSDAGAGKRAAFRARKITVIVPENPKRGKSAQRFDKYKSGMTVQDYLDAGGTTADVRYDEAHKFIELSPE